MHHQRCAHPPAAAPFLLSFYGLVSIVKIMKNVSKFITETLLTIVVAGLVSLVVATLLGFISGNLGWGNDGMMYTTAISSGVFGLIVGYKLNSLIREYK